MNKKALLAIEIIWIILGAICLAIAIREIYVSGFNRSLLYFALTAVAFIFAGLRHSQRKKL